uniref:Homeobox domain-containing protein n=1 Tax=Macrostomum lignano TaxID=282301 RepID=A0A1I8FEM3_9PLAT
MSLVAAPGPSVAVQRESQLAGVRRRDARPRLSQTQTGRWSPTSAPRDRRRGRISRQPVQAYAERFRLTMASHRLSTRQRAAVTF